MAEVIWSETALQDLDRIAEYIALSNLDAAKDLVTMVFDKLERLISFPESGKVPPELEGLNYREVVASPCRVFYKFESGKVFVLHVMRQEQDLNRFLINRS
jgi:toxin ParE1/3/4